MRFLSDMKCDAKKMYSAKRAGVVEVQCFKEKGHHEKDKTSHEGQLYIEGDYCGTLTW